MSDSVKPSRDGMYTLHALDLAEGKVGATPHGHSAEYLDLASTKTKVATPLSKSAKTVADYTERTKSVLCPQFPTSPEYHPDKVIIPNADLATCEDVKGKIEGKVREYVKSIDYNGLHVVEAFVESWDRQHSENPSMTPSQVFHQFEPNSQSESIRTHGGTCVSKAHDIVKLLEGTVEAHVVVESSPNSPANHAAVAIPCRDGILLIEAENSRDMILPLMLEASNEQIYRGDGTPQAPDINVAIRIVETPGNYRLSTPLLQKTVAVGGKEEYFQFLLRPVNRPDLSVMKRWMLTTDFYPVSSGWHDGKQFSLKVNISQGTVTFQIQEEGKGDKKVRIPLAAFDGVKEWSDLDKSKLMGDKGATLTQEERDFFLGDFFKSFHTSTDLLQRQIITIAQHRDTLQQLTKKPPRPKEPSVEH